MRNTGVDGDLRGLPRQLGCSWPSTTAVVRPCCGASLSVRPRLAHPRHQKREPAPRKKKRRDLSSYVGGTGLEQQFLISTEDAL